MALVLGVLYLRAGPLGTDLSAQVSRADFFAQHGWAVLDFGWYGGVSPYGYSLFSPQLMAWLGGGSSGPMALGVLAAVVSSAALAVLFTRTGAARPAWGAAVGAVCVYGNLVSGRTTYAVGVAFGLLALLALTHRRRSVCLAGSLLGAAISSATSPAAGLFVGMCGAAWALSDVVRAPRGGLPDSAPRLVGGTGLMTGAAVPMGAMALLFGAGGWMNISLWDAVRAASAGLIVALLVSPRAIRIGALLSTLGVVVAYHVQTPVGLNVTRLAAMFTLPVLVAYSWRLPWSFTLNRVPRWVRATCWLTVLVGVGLWQPPVMSSDLRSEGDPAARPEYFAPLRVELERRAPIGRIEVVPLANYWDAAWVPATVPLARGWLRQADLAHNPIFFDGTLTAAEYEAWLRDNGVAYVALADAAPSWVGRSEANLIRAGVPYLRQVWRSADWTLYEVDGSPSVVRGARLVASSRSGVVLDATAGEVLVRVRWSRWLSLRTVPSAGGATGGGATGGGATGGGATGGGATDGVWHGAESVGAEADSACLVRRGDWAMLRVLRPGRYVVTGSLTVRGPFCGG